MKTDLLNKVLTIKTLKTILFIVASTFVILFISVTASRINYPYALEQVEGGMLIHVQRVLDGEPIYTGLSAEWVPYTYTPLYYYISAAAAKITGTGFLPLRLVSFLSSIGTLLLIGAFVKKETGSYFLAFISAAFYAASYEAMAQWFDLGRVDPLFLFFLLGGAYLTRFYQSLPAIMAAAVLFTASLLTKQSALIPILPLLLYTIIFYKSTLKKILPITFFAILSAAVLLTFESLSGGNFLSRTFFIAGRISFSPIPHISFWAQYIFGLIPIAFALSLFIILLFYRKKEKEKFYYYLLFLAGMLIVSLLSAVKMGAWRSVLMPCYAAVFIIAGIAIKEFIPALIVKSKETASEGVNDKARATYYIPLLLTVLIIFQFFILNYNPLKAIPTLEDKKAGDRIVELIKNTDGEVYVPMHNYLALLAGKKTYANGIALTALERTGSGDIVKKIRSEILEKIVTGEIVKVITDQPLSESLYKGSLQLKRNLFEFSKSFYTITGFTTRPVLVYERK